jgi:hypothetical protein
MSFENAAKMDKQALLVTSLFEDGDEVSFWRSKTPQERLAALELMRWINYGEHAATSRLQRFLEVVERLR